MPTRFYTSVVFLLALYHFCFFITYLNSEAVKTRTTFDMSFQISKRCARNAGLNYEQEKESENQNKFAQLQENERGINKSLANELPPSRSYAVVDKLFSPPNSFITKLNSQVENTPETLTKNLLSISKQNNTFETNTKSAILSNRSLVPSMNSSSIQDYDKTYQNINQSSIFINFKKLSPLDVTIGEQEKNSGFTRSSEKLKNSKLLSSLSSGTTFNQLSTTSSTVLTPTTFLRRVSLDFKLPRPILTKTSYGPPRQSNQFSKFNSWITKSYGVPYGNSHSYNNLQPNQSLRLFSSQLSNKDQNHYQAQLAKSVSLMPDTFYGLPPKTSNTDVSQLPQQTEMPLISLTYGPSDGLVPPHRFDFRPSRNAFNTNSFHKQRPSEEFLPPSVDLTASFSSSSVLSGSGSLHDPSNTTVNIYGSIQTRNFNRPLNSYESPILGYFFNKYH